MLELDGEVSGAAARTTFMARTGAIVVNAVLAQGCAGATEPAPARADVDGSDEGSQPGSGEGGSIDGSSSDSGGDDGWRVLFEGELTEAWRMSTITNQPGRDDPGSFAVVDGALESSPGTDLGLLWHTEPTPPSFVLRLEWARSAHDDNSGVFVRFPDLDSKGYDNTAWVAIDFGFEIQIDETGAPDGAPVHTTGAIYDQPDQTLSQVPARPVGEWNDYEIQVDDQRYTVRLNGVQVSSFDNLDPARGLPSRDGAPSFIGLQTHTGHVRFRNIRIKTL